MTRQGTRTEQAYARLKDKIMQGELQPGASYLETELAEHLGMSRTPLREAALRLAGDGFVNIRPRSGIEIRGISARDMAEIYEVLTQLEPFAAAKLAQQGLDPDMSAEFDAILDAMDVALATGDLRAWAARDRDFHLMLVEGAGNARLLSLFSSLWDQIHRARMATLHDRPDLATSNADHRQLITLIRAGDAKGAERLHRRHRAAAQKVLVTLLKQRAEDSL